MWDILIMSLTIAALYGISPLLHKRIFSTHRINCYTMLLLSSAVFFACSIVGYVLNSDVIKKDIKMLLRNIHVLLWLVLSAVFSIFIANLLYYQVIQKPNAKSHVVSALIFTAPLFTLILSYLLLQEGITYAAISGVLMIVCGVCILTLS